MQTRINIKSYQILKNLKILKKTLIKKSNYTAHKYDENL